MTMNHPAIYRAYPQVVAIYEDRGAIDADGNQVQLDQAKVDAAATIVAEEQAWDKLRTDRNNRLAECDWVVTRAIERADDGFGIQLPQDWMQYRQALRDLPANTADPANPVWPTKPGGN